MSLLSRFNPKSRSIKKNIRTRSLRCENLEERRLLTVVTSLNDDGMAGTLRAEIAATPDMGTVTFVTGANRNHHADNGATRRRQRPYD